MDSSKGLEEIRNELGKWKISQLEPAESCSQRQPSFQTPSNIEVKPLYTPLDLAECDFDYLRDLGFPGQQPFTRGRDPLMYRSALWNMSQYTGFASAEETNQRIHYNLKQGQTSFGLALDLPTQLGYDSDHPRAEGEVGKVGLAIDSLEDIETVFKGVPLNKMRRVGAIVSSIAPVLAAMLIVVGEKSGLRPREFNVGLQNDILNEYLARGNYIFPPEPSLRLVADVIEHCARDMPNWITLTVNGYHTREAGGTAVQEVAFCLANALEYIRLVAERDVEVDGFARNVGFFMTAHMDLFEEVAKLRAMRKIWARLLAERFGAKDPESLGLKIMVMTGGSTFTAQQPLNNLVRGTVETLVAVLAGVQHVNVSAYDEALALPSEQGVKLGLRTQQILACESGVGNTVDPLAGSYYVESLTKELEKRIIDYIQRVDAIGGAAAAVEKGFYQQEIAREAYKQQKAVETAEKVVVGVNRYQDAVEQAIPLLRIDPGVRERQCIKLKELRRRRDNRDVLRCLNEVKLAAKSDVNIMPAMIEAVRAYATIGEISDVLRDCFGEYIDKTDFF